LLVEQRELMNARLARLESEKESASKELTAALAQKKEIATQLEISQKQTDDLERLHRSRLLTSARFMEQRRDLIDSKVRFSESNALVERVRGRIETLTRDMEAVRQERRTYLNDRIEAVEREVAQLDLTLRDAGAAPSTAEPPVQPVSLTYSIARRSGAGAQAITANLFTEVMPGDVVIVSSQPRPLGGLSSLPSDPNLAITTLEQTQSMIETSMAPRSPIGELPMIPMVPH
jgi:hypothetical protein